VLHLHREPTDLGVLIGEVIAAFRTQAGSGGAQADAAAPGDIPLAEIDPLRVREVLINLTANALRHTPPGASIAAPTTSPLHIHNLPIISCETGYRTAQSVRRSR